MDSFVLSLFCMYGDVVMGWRRGGREGLEKEERMWAVETWYSGSSVFTRLGGWELEIPCKIL